MRCGRCRYAMALSSAPSSRCPRCGCVHLIDGSVVSPPMRCLEYPGECVSAGSPWIDRRYQPTECGSYELRFRGIDAPLRAHWNGRWWEWQNRPLDLRTLTSWRGQWQKL